MMFVSFNSISQTTIQENKTEVVLDTLQARAVIKDLITGKAAKELNDIANRIIVEQDKQISVVSESNLALEDKVSNLEVIVKSKDNLLELQYEAIEQAEQSLRKQKNKTLLFKITTVAAVLTAGYFAAQ